MDEVVLIIGLVVIALLVSPIVAIRALIETKRLRSALSQLNEKVDRLTELKRGVYTERQSSTSKGDDVYQREAESSIDTADSLGVNESSPIVESLQSAANDTPEVNLESKVIVSNTTNNSRRPLNPLENCNQTEVGFGQQIVAHLKRNWLVWIGGLALVFGIGYLVQFVGSRIEISPQGRITGSLILSVAIVGFAEWLHRQIQAKRWRLVDIPNQDYIPATFAAAGMTGIYLTIVFATVMYQLVPESWALGLIALTALVCLTLSYRFGSLMAILGLIGGYTAPFWVGEGTPNFYVFMSYICMVTAAGLYVRPRMNVPWLSLFISLAHIGWLGLMSSAIETDNLTLWVSLFYPLSTYLLVLVPHQGWALKVPFRQRVPRTWYHPAIIAGMIGALILIAESHLPLSNFTLFSLAITPFVMLLLPAVRRGYSSRESQLLSLVSTVILTAVLHLHLLNTPESLLSVLGVLALWTVLLVLRSYRQFSASYRSTFSYWWAVSCGALMLIGVLVYVEGNYPDRLWLTSLFALGGCIGLGGLAKMEPRLRSDLSASIHAVLLVLNYIWFYGEVFTALLALQVLAMTLQMVLSYAVLRDVVVKIAVSLLLTRLSLLPVIESWQQGLSPQGWVAVANCLPAIVILGFALKMMREKSIALADWFEGALVHVIAIFVLMQSHYWLTGSFVIFDKLDLTSVSFWLIEALVLVGVYSYRQQFSHTMHYFYLCYRYALLLVALICMFLLNTQFMPLSADTVSATAIPLFNGLSLGWLLPGAALIILAHRNWCPEPVQPRWLYVVGGGLLALWLALSIRQFWQTESMSILETTSMAEWLTYSAALVILGALWTYIGVVRQKSAHQTYGLIVVGLAVVKVFISDVSYLDGIWRAASFLGLGLALIGLGWLFQTLKKRHGEAELEK